MLKFKRLKPALPLRSFIQGYWQIESGNQQELLDLIPDGHPEIVIMLKNKILMQSAGKEQVKVQPDAGVIGQLTGRFMTLLPPNTRTLYVKLYPWTPFLFFRTPMCNLNDGITELDALTNDPPFRQLVRDLRSAGTMENQAALLDAFFLKKLAFQKLKSPFLCYAIQQIFQTNGTASIESLTKNIHASRRYVEKIFKKEVGMPPKQYARLIRVKKATIILANENFTGNISRVAAHLNYYDQSHFVKDFKTITDQTPSQFLREQPYFPLDKVGEYLGQWDYS